MSPRTTTWVVTALLTAAVAAGQQPPAGPSEPTPSGSTPAEAAAPAASAAYDATGRRDPFRPFVVEVRPEPAVYATPLERYELGQLTVVGTMWAISPPRAMVEDSAGMGFIVTLGTPIGRNRGVVTAIEPQRVVVEERSVDYYGNERVNRIVMETPRDEGPKQSAREQQ